jgi:hypothetical protein
MKDYTRAIWSECLKLKRSQPLGLMCFAPLTVTFMFFCIGWRSGGPGWAWLMPNIVILWTALFLPLCIALETELLADLEVRGQQWKHLFALPVSRGAYYTAKLTTALLLLALSLVVLGLSAWVAGRTLGVLRPELEYGAFPFAAWTRYSIYLLPSAGLLLALHTWVSLRFRSFVPGMALSFLGMGVAGLLVAQDMWPYFPWRLPLYLIAGLESGTYDPTWMWAGALGGLLCATLGGWEVTRRDVF